MIIDLEGRGIGVYFTKPWTRDLIRFAWEKGEVTSAEAWSRVYLSVARTTVIAFLNKCVKDGLLTKEPSEKTGLEYLYRTKSPGETFKPTEFGFKHYLRAKLHESLMKEAD
jgi:predicted DNA-binding transcriptional regulator